MAELTQTTVHLDELKQYELRDRSKLTPGTELVFVHLPELRDPEIETGLQEAYATSVKVLEVKDATFAELHPKVTNPIETEALPVILYEDSEGHRGYRYLSASGVIPYLQEGDSSYYNGTNFTVLPSELEEKGLTPVFEVTDKYAEELESYNGKITVYSYSPDWDNDEYLEDGYSDDES